MQFITISRRYSERFPEEAFTSKREEEAERVRVLYSEGYVRQIWFRGDEAGACILWEAENEAKVRQLVESLPFYKAGLLDLQHVIPALPYAGFGPRL